MRRRPLIVIFALVLVVLGVSTLSAAGEITLESLAAAISKVMQRQDDFEKRLVVIEKELNIPTATPTQTVLATETAAASDIPTATRTAEPTSTPRPTNTAAPTATPTPSFSSVDFSEVVAEYENNRIRFEDRFIGKRVYITGEIDRLTERGGGYQIEFDGAGLDLVCRLPAAARADVLGLSIGDTAIAYGQAELDSNFFTDDDLLFKACSVASDADGVILPPTATRTRTPTLTPRPTASPTRTLTFTPGPTSTPKPTSTRRPTSTPKPTSTRRPTSTPRPTVCRKAQLHSGARCGERAVWSRNELPDRWKGQQGPDIYPGRTQSSRRLAAFQFDRGSSLGVRSAYDRHRAGSSSRCKYASTANTCSGSVLAANSCSTTAGILPENLFGCS